MEDVHDIGSEYFGRVTDHDPVMQQYFDVVERIINKRFGDL